MTRLNDLAFLNATTSKPLMNPLCSIIIPTYNTATLTLRCIQQIKKFPPVRPYEIIVVDNHSQDMTYEQVVKAHPDIVFCRNAMNMGFGKACNVGAQVAKGRYLLFLNSDTEALENTFEILMTWMDSHPTTGIVGPQLIQPDGSVSQMSWGWNPVLAGELLQRFFAPHLVERSTIRRRLIRFLQRQSREVPYICGACLMMRREAFQEIGGFDEIFELYFEDCDLCLRCIKAGWQVHFLPDAKIIHHLGGSMRDSWNQISLIYQQSHIAYYRNHAHPWSVRLLKAYLRCKWIYLLMRSRFHSNDLTHPRAYVERYLQTVSEKTSIRLSDPLIS